MAGERSDHDLPDDDDQHEGGDSTIAMAAPSFDPAILATMRSPISEPPPALPDPPASPHTAPVGFMPVASTSPAVPPTVGRAKAPSSPMVPTPLGGLVPHPVVRAPAPAPAPAAAPPAAAPPAARAEVAAPAGSARTRARAQTVIGLAPAPPGSPRPVIVRPAAGKAQLRPPSVTNEAANKDAFALDASLAEAARAATFTPGMRVGSQAAIIHGSQTPEAIGSAPLPTLESSPPPEDSTRTLAVPRERLPPPSSSHRAPLPQIDVFDKEEETQARDAAYHVQDARVVRDDVGGDDATLAVAPQANDARHQLSAAYAQSMANEGVASPHLAQGAPGGYGQHSHTQHGQGGHVMPPPQPMAPPQHGGWNERQSSPSWYGPGPGQQAQQVGQAMPMQQHPHMPPQPYGGQFAPPPPPQLAVGQPASKITGQVILVAVVGVICVGVFIAGLVLFATTKF